VRPGSRREIFGLVPLSKRYLFYPSEATRGLVITVKKQFIVVREYSRRY
jgi:hypothetical protein